MTDSDSSVTENVTELRACLVIGGNTTGTSSDAPVIRPSKTSRNVAISIV